MNTAHQPWLATYREHGIAADINPDAHPSVVALLEQAMRTHAGRIAFRSPGRALSYAEIDRLSGYFAAWLQQMLQVKKGDRVAVMLPNVPAFPIALLGIARAGAVQVNINPLYTPRELEHQLRDSGAAIIVVFQGSTPALAEVVARTGVKSVVTVAASDYASDPPVDARLAQAVSFASALHAGAGLMRLPVPLCGDDPLFLQYTGGTSGLSKGAVLSHRNLVANTGQFKAMNSGALRPGEEVLVTAIPLYHIFALMVNFISYFSVGAENWLVDNPRDLDAFIDVLDKARPTVFVGVNTLYNSLVSHPRIGEVDFSRLRIAIGGGAAVVRAVSDRWLRLTGTFIREGYGLTETSPVLSFAPPGVDAFSGNTGLPLPGTDLRLLDELEREVAPGQPGEVCVKGPQVMDGYWRQPEANADAFTADGYFKTGDIGVLDAAGFLTIVDRKKDMVIVSGFNVYPSEVDAVASTCPGVAECACIGVPDEKSGEALMLFVVGTPGRGLRAEDVTAWCRAALTAYKVPKTVRLVDSLPKSTVGKILRRELLRSAVPS
ncbi:long-chain-fatty-acid--coA ligase FadD [Janthinobacterium sp. HH01]|uniref:AMP-binding protein n=1 Tax=Janthinobacterium sp. HH01 TaxID=1198452 RepID=UPI0002AEB3F4|nr:AMP-binding protein [Janthinobacterium sp. HH01]ELX09253.1 long-chain-fatty-acid--coA ligase FadD [Janthinobacterium sp. HH01]